MGQDVHFISQGRPKAQQEVRRETVMTSRTLKTGPLLQEIVKNKKRGLTFKYDTDKYKIYCIQRNLIPNMNSLSKDKNNSLHSENSDSKIFEFSPMIRAKTKIGLPIKGRKAGAFQINKTILVKHVFMNSLFILM